MVRPQYSYKTLDEFIAFLNTAVGYLEKANKSNLGDFTPNGKIVNAGSANYTVYWQWYSELGYGNLQGEAYCAGAGGNRCLLPVSGELYQRYREMQRGWKH